MIKYFFLIILSCFAFATGLYQPHVLRTMKGEMVLSEYAQVIKEPAQSPPWYDPDTIKIPGLKSPVLATGISCGATILPPLASLFYVNNIEDFIFPAYFSILIGPSTGYFYANKWWRGLGSIGVRIIITGSAIGGLLILDKILPDDPSGYGNAFIGVCWLYMAGCVYLGTAVYDCLSIHDIVRDENIKIKINFYRELDQHKVGLGLSYKF